MSKVKLWGLEGIVDFGLSTYMVADSFDDFEVTLEHLDVSGCDVSRIALWRGDTLIWKGLHMGHVSRVFTLDSRHELKVSPDR